ncbi:MAG TPA: O-antigen ligase family protein [Rhodoferax sp.]
MRNIRLWIVYFVAISVSMGTAVSAIGRLALYLLALWFLLSNLIARKPRNYWPDGYFKEYWQVMTLSAVAFMAMSIGWSEADSVKSVLSWTRHARLLTIPLVWILIRDRVESRSVLRVFVIAQLFVVASAWMLIWGLPVPWATALNAKTTFAVFGSYLEQSITSAAITFVLWYQRDWIFGKHGKVIAVVAALATTIQVLGFLEGRSGYLVFVALASLAIFYQFPKRWRWSAVVIPFLAVAVVFIGFKTARDRIVLVKNEVAAYAQHTDIHSSSGERLIYWQTSLKSIADHPVLGAGSGGWNHEFRRLTGEKFSSDFYSVDNPHQMFLLWAVEGGLIGLALLMGLLFSIYMRSRSLAVPDRRSLQSSLAALVIAGLTTSTIYGIGFGDYCCMLIGILLSTGHPAGHTAPQREISPE